MDTSLVKLLLAAAILLVLWNAVSKRRRQWGMGGGGGAPRGYYANEFYEDSGDDEDYEDGEDEDEDEDEEEDEDEDYEDGEDEDEDYEDGEDEDEDYGEDYGEDYEGYQDEDYEDGEDYAEGYSNSGPMMSTMSASAELLPKPQRQMQRFSEFAPKSLKGQNFLDASKFIGVNTQGSSLRNANYDLRSAPAIGRKDVGPWSQSTIDPDPFRKPLE